MYLPVSRLIYRIFDLTGYDKYAAAMPAGKTRQANLAMLVQKAEDYEKTSYQGLFDFIRYIEKLKNTTPTSVRLPAPGNMTTRCGS